MVIQKLLMEAATLSEASAMVLEPRTRKPAPESRHPHVAGDSTFDWARAQFRECETDSQRSKAIARVREELAKVRGQHKAKEALVSPQQRIASWQGSEPKTVAEALNTTPSLVRRWRSAQGFDPETGRPRDRALLAQALKVHHGMSTRQIALKLRVSQATIVRDLAAVESP